MKRPAWRCCFAYFLFISLFCFSVICPAGALADAGSSPGPRVIVVGGASLPDEGSPAGTDAGDAVEGETGEAPLPDPVEPGEDPGQAEDPGPAGEEDPEASPEASLGEKDREALAGLPSPEDVSGSGASVYRLPLAVPPGRNGMDPGLFLTYHSRRGNGPAGVGWGLDFGSIRRSTKRGVDYGARDFVVEGGGDYVELVPREADRGPGHYGAKIEEGFTKYRYNAATGGWTAFGKDGRVSSYGSTASSRQAGSKGVFRWCLDGVEDSNGNGMTVSYLKDGGQVYPEVLSYPGGSGTVTVRFSWEGRPDVLVRYDAGFPVASGKRLKAVAVSTGGALVRRYVLEYEPGSPSRFSALRAYGADGVTSLPAVGFTYQAGGTGEYGPAVSGVTGLVSAGPEVHFIEVNGDGRADLLVLERQVRALRLHTYLSRGDGSFAFSRVFEIFEVHPYETAVHLGDVTGDGLPDLVAHRFCVGRSAFEWNELLVFPALGDGTFGPAVKTELAGRVSWNDSLFFQEVNGDGRDDLVVFRMRTGDYRVYLSGGDGSFAAASHAAGKIPKACETRAFFADVNGDGLSDAICHETVDFLGESTIDVFLSRGDGTFAPAGGQDLLSREGYFGLRFADVNGDGLADLVTKSEVSKGRYVYRRHLSRGDGSFEEAAFGKDIFVCWNEDFVFADVTGDGLPDRAGWLVQAEIPCAGDDGVAPVADAPDPPVSVRLSIRAAMGNTAGLLSTIAQDHGGRVAIAYGSSSGYDNAFLPFPLPVVTALSVDDGLGNLSQSTYDYEGGYFDAGTREFRGFGTVTKTRPDGSVETTRYHNGDAYLKHKPFLRALVERAGGSWAAVSSVESTWTAKTLSAEGGTPCKQVTLSKKRETLYGGKTAYREEVNTWDGAGNLTRRVTTGTGLETVTETYTWENAGTWLWRKTGESLRGSATGPAREVRCRYERDTGNLLSESWLNGTVTRSMTYDGYGNKITETDPEGNVTTTEYDSSSATYPVRVTRPVTGGIPHVTTIEAYDFRFGKPTRVKDENQNVTAYGYDVFGRLVKTTHSDGGGKTITYYDNTCPRYTVTGTKETAGSTIDRYAWYDGLGREVQSMAFGEGGTPVVTLTAYDAMGRVAKKTGPFFGRGRTWPQSSPGDAPLVATFYDSLDRPLRMEKADGTYGTVVTTFSYSGYDTMVTDPDGGRKTEHRDALGRVTAVTEYLTGSTLKTDYTYNAAGDLLGVTDGKGNRWTNTYDTLGRRTKMTDPDLGTRSYAYDKNGNRTSETDGKGQTINYAYDGLNRLVTKTFSTGDPPVTYAYDTAQNGRGRPAFVTCGDQVTACNAYDRMGRLTMVTKTLGGKGYTTGHAYDLSGKKTKVTHPDGTAVAYEYHGGSNLLWRVSSGGTVFGACTGYEPSGKMGRLVQGNGAVTIYGYDPKSTRLLSLTTTGKTGEVLQKKSYRYTKAGDLKRITDGLKNVTYDYTYDGLHRLTSEKRTKGSAVSTDTWSYDGIGNMTSKRAGGVSFTFGYDKSRPHALRSVSVNGKVHYLSYDENGNLVYGPDLSDPSNPGWRALSWTAEGRPEEITYKDKTAPVRVRFTYDGEGKRTKKTVLSLKLTRGTSIDPEVVSETLYVDDACHITNGRAVTYIFAGTIRVAEIRNGVTSYYHKDHLGSSAVLTDSQGRVVESAEYLPFGEIREHGGTWTTDYKFTDQEMDTESGLYNFNARLYDPALGRFVSPDPAVPDLSNPKNQRVYDPQVLNRYAYCRNNPMIYVDPTGLGEVESTSFSSTFGDDSENDHDGNREGWGCDTSGFDGPTGMVSVNPYGVTIINPGRKNIYIKYAQVDWPSLNAFFLGSRPRGFFVCDRVAGGILGFLGFNHAYGFSYKTDVKSWGMGGSFGIGIHEPEEGPVENMSCGCIEGSINKEQSIMNALIETADDGPWIGYFHDCHSALERAMKCQGLVFTGSPNGRWGR